MTGIIGDDDGEIEAEIQRELDEISEDNLEIEDLENEDLISPYLNEKDADALPDSLQQYLKAVQSRTQGAEQDVKDCDTVLNKLPKGSINDEEEEILAQKIKEALGNGCYDNPLDIRKKVLSEIEELEQNEEKVRRESSADKMTIDVIRRDISDQIRTLEEAAEKQLLELEEKQANKYQKRIEWYEEMKREENERMKKEQEMRRQRRQEWEAAQRKLNEHQQDAKEKLEKEVEQEKQKFDLLQQQFQVELKEIEEENKKEKAALEEMKNQEAEYQRKRQHAAAVKIQKMYRGHRVYLQHKDILQQQRSARLKKYEEELEKQEQEEKEKLEEMEKRKQEEKRNQEEQEKKRIEKERKRKEEHWKREREEERRKEEEKRKMEQLRKEEENKRKEAAEQEQRRREEEEERRKTEQLKKEEEEKKRKEVEEREEQKRKEEKKKEEAKKRELQLKEKQKKEEERKRIEEEQRRKAEEKKIEEELRKEIERREKEQNRIEEEKQADAKRKESEEIINSQLKKEEENREEEQQKMEKEIGNQDRTKSGESEGLGLDHLEERRLQWVKDHTPWSSTTSQDNRVQPVAKMKARQRPRRPFSASRNLPSLTEEQLLQASPPGTTLNKVVRVCVSCLPACNMHGLKHCPDLLSLTIHNCGMMAVEGLEECKSMKELQVQNNCIEYISCRDLHNLEEVLLNNNHLTSVQGFDGCKELRHLDLANNKITRLGDLSSCCQLQNLYLDNNQLIMTRGLSSLPNLQSLSCANNHLPNIKEIDSCQLLQTLNLQGNNLQQPPLLSNHALLRELILDDNSISTLDPLSQVWLPSLRLLFVSQNSISKLESLEGLIMLETLDVSHNLISDLDSLMPGLSQCRKLKVLRITGNPVNEDPDCRKAIVESLAFLTKLDDEALQPKKSSSGVHWSSFITMCQNQLTEYENTMARHATELSSFDENTVDPRRVRGRLNVKSKQYKERHQLAVTHLKQHEQYGTGDQEHPKLSHDAPQTDEKGLNKPEVKDKMSRCEQTESSQSHAASVNVDEPKANDAYSFEGNKPGRADWQQKRLADDSSIRTAAAVQIQAVWRGWHVRHLIDVQMTKWLAAVTIQAAWRGYDVRSRMRRSRVSRARKALWNARDHAAATTIQACYRGYRVRQRIASALRAVDYYNDDHDDDDLNYDEEVDLSAFDYDSGLLDEGWTPTDTPQLPSRGPILPGPGQPSNRYKQSDTNMPRQAWRSADSPMAETLQTNQRGAPRSHSNQRSPEQDLVSVTSGTQSHLTHRAEEMSNEWGLKDPTTAELMWKRANRMKYNPARKKKLLDPTKRLALFKKLDEANKLREVKPPPRRQPQRVDYFAARDAFMLPSRFNTPTSERETKAQMTYSWVYNQGVIHVDQDEPGLGLTKDYSTEQTKNKKSPAKRNASKSRSPITLPQMDPVALTGRNVPLVSNAVLMRDQMSKDDTPTARRNSSASETRSAASGASGLSPEKSNSAGARMTKERKRR